MIAAFITNPLRKSPYLSAVYGDKRNETKSNKTFNLVITKKGG